MPDRELVLKRLLSEYNGQATDAFLDLYASERPELAVTFASLHERANGLLAFMNAKNNGSGGGHFNAHESRELISLLGEIQEVVGTLKRVGIVFEVRDDYKKVFDDCRSFLVSSGGSAIPPDFGRVPLERFEAVFGTGAAAAPTRSAEPLKLTVVGEGAFALVHKYRDPLLDMDVALKTARKNLSDRDRARFRQEYDTLKGLNFPYIVRAYTYDELKTAYTMEFCDSTLYDYIQKNNARLTWNSRRRIALQFLYGLNYLHLKGIMHRDISRKNVLVQAHDLGAVTVKLSDFGLHKTPESDFTKVDSSMKGTILDPTLEHFADFGPTNDIYAAGHVLSYIFTGRSGLDIATGPLRQVIDKCTHGEVARRYSTVAEVITALEALVDPGAATA